MKTGKKGKFTGAQAIFNYNPIIDNPLAYTRQDIMDMKDKRHKELFPEKYDENGNRTEE